MKALVWQACACPAFGAAGPLGAGTPVLLPAYGCFTGQSLQVPEVYRWRYAVAGDAVLAIG